MERKKIRKKLRGLIENGVVNGHRTMFVIVGDNSKDQVDILHCMRCKIRVESSPSVLWCYKNKGFSSLTSATNVHYCHYSETHKILGNTFGMCVLQDFEALTPNLLAETIETVEGGGIIVILLKSMTSLKQLYTMTMDAHGRFCTESHVDAIGRFNERFVLSLASCENCTVFDDQLRILPISAHSVNVKRKVHEEDNQSQDCQLAAVKESLQDTQPVGDLINCCRTLDQAKALLRLVDSITEKSLRSTVSLTAARGRGKSATLGLAIASAIAFGYINIFVTSPNPENLNTLFEFVFKGFDALKYEEHVDYELVQSTNPEFNKAIIRVNIFRDYRQTIQYIHPSDVPNLGQAELVIIDEAAAIPLPLVKSLLGPYLVFMATTTTGYEGTGQSLSLKLRQQLRQQAAPSVNVKSSAESVASATGRILHELCMNESIRYRVNDPVERWLNMLLCLDATVVQKIAFGCPVPDDCDLYYINRDTLFSYHKASEEFLQRIMSLYMASHYQNSPDDMQMLSDAPGQHLFCLLGPVDFTKSDLPEVLCIIQVCLEGELSQSSVTKGLVSRQTASGDLIPWTVAKQFSNLDFPLLSGARIVRIASHPDFQRMGYGTRALQLLQRYYSGLIPCTDEVPSGFYSQETSPVAEEEVDMLEEQIRPRVKLPPLLLKLSERPAEHLDYIGVSFGLTADLLRFWKRSGFVPVYLSETPNKLTREHSCIMLHTYKEDTQLDWLMKFWLRFRETFFGELWREHFKTFHPSLVLSILQNKTFHTSPTTMSKEELDFTFTSENLDRLERYTKNMADFYLIEDLLCKVAKLYYQQKLGSCNLTAVQCAVLAGFGLQKKSVDAIAKELEQPKNQILGLFNRLLRQIVQHLNSIDESAIAQNMITESNIVMEPLKTTVEEELDEEAKKMKKRQTQLDRLKDLNMVEYSIKGTEDDWQKALSDGSKTVISMKSISSKRKIVQDDGNEFSVLEKQKKKKKSRPSKKH